MAKINKVYPAFYNGVSQQSPELALDSNCKDMTNCIPDIVRGLRKRPPLKYKTKRDFATYPEMETATVFHTYDRGEDNEEYILVNTNDSNNPLKVFDSEGNEVLVDYNSDNETNLKTYLNRGNLKGLTVQDRTWVYSKNAVVGVDKTTTEPLNPDYTKVAYYWLKRGSGDRYNPFNYAVYLNGITYACNPNKPSQDIPDPATGFEDVDFAAAYLASLINGAVANEYLSEIRLNAKETRDIELFIGKGLTLASPSTSVTSIETDTNIIFNVDVSNVDYDTTTGIFTATIANTSLRFTQAAAVSFNFRVLFTSNIVFTCRQEGGLLQIYRADGGDFEFSTWDSWGDQASKGFKGSVNKLSDLPKDMPFSDVYIKVVGDEANSFTDYFVKWNGSSWEECLDPEANRGTLTNMPIKMDRTFVTAGIKKESIQELYSGSDLLTYLRLRETPTTLPSQPYTYTSQLDIVNNLLINSGYCVHASINGSSGYYTWSELVAAKAASTPIYLYLYRQITFTSESLTTESIDLYTDNQIAFSVDFVDWSQPKVGNLENNPDPSFVDRQIQDMFFYKNRLGIASADSVVLTEAANYTNFYVSTAIDIIATDPIDVTIASNQASKIYYVKPFNNSLYIFTKNAQYELTSDGGFAPDTVSINNTTNYPMSIDVEPIVVNDSLYFISTTNNRQQLREYIKTETLSVKGVDLNVSTPTYLEAPIKKIIADGVLGYVLCCTAANTVYLYNFKEDGTNRIQSAWSKWTLLNSLNASNFEYFNLASKVLVMCKTSSDYRYHQMLLDYTVVNDNVDESNGVAYNYTSSIQLPTYYPQISGVRTPLNKVLLKKVTVQGEGQFDAVLYRKDYDKEYSKSHTLGMQDLDFHVSSKVDDVELYITDSSEKDFSITSVVLEGLYKPSSREMK